MGFKVTTVIAVVIVRQRYRIRALPVASVRLHVVVVLPAKSFYPVSAKTQPLRQSAEYRPLEVNPDDPAPVLLDRPAGCRYRRT